MTIYACALGLLLSASPPILADESDLRVSFATPPAEARPWVYWMWLSSNLTREGITADLEAMQRVGIGGALIMDVDQGTPPGAMKFFDEQWKAMFKHTVEEAKRLGLEINMNNGAGYFGSGGPWVKPEQGMQWVFRSETHVKGAAAWKGVLPKPVDRADYRDIAVLAVSEPPVPEKDRYEIPGLTMKALMWKTWVAYRGTQSAPLDAKAPGGVAVSRDLVIDLTARMDAAGHLDWAVPRGEWTILRIGHAYNGSRIGPAPEDQRGPETDKLSKAATTFHFDAFVKRLDDLVGPAGRPALVATHIDSWEGGGQNWTVGMREEFKRRRGYDLLTYLPVVCGRVIGDLQTSERFLFDLRKTVSELMVENYVAEFQRLARARGLRFTFESYTTSGNDLDAANFADEPMAEFWTPTGQGEDFYPTTKSMSSSAHLSGRTIVGAEAFTSFRTERWLWHPAMIKRLGDDAFTQGVNRFVFHRYAVQPFLDPKPGLQMGPWGLHYERTNTWWEWTRPWHTYLARCQFMLRQGEPVADVLRLQSEEPLRRFQLSPLAGYDYDASGPDSFQSVTIRDGRLALPSGRRYRLLVLDHTGTMTVLMLTRIRDLVRDGAAILGNPPQATPGLTDYPKADAELKRLAEELWGAGAAVTARTVGKGQVFRGISPEHALALLEVGPDFMADRSLRWIHRADGEADIYFVANPTDDAVTVNCTFRAAGKEPELWDAETGRTVALPTYSGASPGRTRLSIPFRPNGSMFVVFRPGSGATASPIESVTRDGRPVFVDGLAASSAPVIDFAEREIQEAGVYVLTGRDGNQRRIDVPPLPDPLNIEGPWILRFPSGWGAPSEVTLPELVSWKNHPHAGVKYFSGTAIYSKNLVIPARMLGENRRLRLDLGRVAVMAKVTLNGRDLGILWKAPYSVDVTSVARAGDNALEISVVNLWPNRLIGDEGLPEDSERKSDGTLRSWPSWLREGRPSPTGRFTFSSWRLWKEDDLLQDSGLLGPVTVRTVALLPP
jgi:alpha-L-rhamnosidase